MRKLIGACLLGAIWTVGALGNGWHTFRHSLATLLVKKREGIKVVQELMRHADSRTTLDIYSQSDDEDKRAAQKHISGLFVVEQAS